MSAQGLSREIEALTALRHAIDGTYTDHETWILLGDTVRNLGDFKYAERAYARAVQLEPLNALWRVRVVDAVHQQQDCPRALELARAALAAIPGDPSLMACLARYLFEVGELVEAESLLLDAIERAPDLPDSYATLGLLRWETGRLDEAKALLDQARLLAPDYEYFKTIRDLMERGGTLERRT